MKQYWRVFYTRPRTEKSIEGTLDRKGIEVFLPKIAVLRQWKNGKHRVEEPLFRSYIFAHVNEADRLRVVQTMGIVRCVMFNGKTAEVSEDEIEQIKIMLRDPARLSQVQDPLPPLGEEVVVMRGALRGLRGEVIRHGTQTYVVVRVEAIGKSTKVNVPAQWVMPVPKSDPVG